MHASAWFLYCSPSNKSLLIQTLVLKNYGRKAIVTFVCTWLHCEKRQITLIVSHCTQGFQNSGLKGQDREIYFLTARLHQLYLSMRYCSRAPDFLLDHVMQPQITDILSNWVLTSPVTTYLPSGEKESVVMVFLLESGGKYLRQCWNVCILLFKRLPLHLVTHCLWWLYPNTTIFAQPVAWVWDRTICLVN